MRLPLFLLFTIISFKLAAQSKCTPGIRYRVDNKNCQLGRTSKIFIEVINSSKNAIKLYQTDSVFYVEDSIVEKESLIDVGKDTVNFVFTPKFEGYFKFRYEIAIDDKGQEKRETHVFYIYCYKPSVIVKTQFGNTVYVGIDNELDIAASGYLREELRVSPKDGNAIIITQGSGRYILKTNGKNDKLTIRVNAIHDSGLYVLGEQELEVKHAPRPTCFLESHLNEESPNAQTLKIQVTPNLPFCNGSVDSFTLQFKEHRKNINQHVIGNQIDNHMLQRLLALPSGTRVYFNEVHYTIRTGAGEYPHSTHWVEIR